MKGVKFGWINPRKTLKIKEKTIQIDKTDWHLAHSWLQILNSRWSCPGLLTPGTSRCVILSVVTD